MITRSEFIGGPMDGELAEIDAFLYPVVIIAEGLYVCGGTTLAEHLYYWKGVEMPNGMTCRVAFR